MGWVLALFDLPTFTKKQRKAAAKFRKSLLQDGFTMLQYSVYVRPCVSLERIQKHTDRIKNNAPSEGNVKILFFTEKQWQRSIDVCLEAEYSKKYEFPREIPKQILFW